jgi:Magnesium chelatase, subunit ChlI C-terminal
MRIRERVLELSDNHPRNGYRRTAALVRGRRSRWKTIATKSPDRCPTGWTFTSKLPWSNTKAERVLAARKLQQERFAAKPKCSANTGITHNLLKTYRNLNPEGRELLHRAMEELHLNARAYNPT